MLVKRLFRELETDSRYDKDRDIFITPFILSLLEAREKTGGKKRLFGNYLFCLTITALSLRKDRRP